MILFQTRVVIFKRMLKWKSNEMLKTQILDFQTYVTSKMMNQILKIVCVLAMESTYYRNWVWELFFNFLLAGTISTTLSGLTLTQI